MIGKNGEMPQSGSPAPDLQSMMACAVDKAGMKDVDREAVNRKIEELSRGSSFFKNELRKAAIVSKQVAEISARLEIHRRNAKSRLGGARVGEILIAKCKAKPFVHPYFFHVDMDAFFCAVEMRDNPALTPDIPMAVGSEAMISTANYAARKYGVRAAMPGFIARQLCPELRLVKVNGAKYAAAGKIIRDVLSEYDKNLESSSWDEASLDLSSYMKSRFSEVPSLAECELVAQEIRSKIAIATGGLTCSAGMAPSRLLAKIATEERKPNGQFVLTVEAADAYISQKPIRKVPGIGKIRERILHEAFGIETCAQVQEKADDLLCAFTPASTEAIILLGVKMLQNLQQSLLHRSSLGKDGVKLGSERQSCSRERSFSPECNLNFLRQRLRALCEKLAGDLERYDVEAKHVDVRIKYADFSVKLMGKVQAKHIYTSSDLFQAAVPLFSSMVDGVRAVRMIGVKAAALSKKSVRFKTARFFKVGPVNNNGTVAESAPKLGNKYGVVTRRVIRFLAGPPTKLQRVDAERIFIAPSNL